MLNVAILAAAALFAVSSTATAEVQQPAPIDVEVEGQFANGEEENTELSGIACSTALGENTRTCLVALDEGFAAQWVTLTLDPTPKLKVGDAARLFGRSTEDDEELLKGIPPAFCSRGTGDFDEHDSEGVAFAQGHFFLTGSHGCGRNRHRFKASAFIDVRIAAPGAAESPALTTGLNPLFAGIEDLADAYGQDVAAGEGISIEGIAASGNVLFFGLRSPVLADGASIVEVGASELFSGGATKAIPHTADLGGLGIRDLAVLDSKPISLLVLTGEKAGEAGRYEVFRFVPKDGGGLGESARIATLPVPDGEKAEGLLVAARDGKKIRVLVIHDGVPDGDPTLYDLVLP